MKRRFIRALGTIGALALMTALILSAGCARKVYVPVERVSTVYDTVWRTRTVRVGDTVASRRIVMERVLDSIAPHLDSAGRMTGFERYRITERHEGEQADQRHIIYKSDSLRVHTAESDSVSKTAPLPRPAEGRQRPRRSIIREILTAVTAFAAGMVLGRRKK